VIRAVIDTNVWVAGLLSSTGAPARVVDLVLRASVIPIVSPAMLDELQEVFQRPELGLRAHAVAAVIAYLRLPGNHVVHVDPAEPEPVCKDPDDDVFTAAALEGKAEYIVTGNTKHFPSSPWRGIHIVTPKTFVSRA
jgi:putative PIN family toxin of toxin-antitoxin system